MVSRRLIRIKTLQVVYAYLLNNESSINKSEKELFLSLHRAHDLYHYLLQLIIDIAEYAENKIDTAKQKHIRSFEDLNPNTRFIKNKVIEQLKESHALSSHINNNKFNWLEFPELIKRLYLTITETESYAKYMNNPDTSYEVDKQFIIDIFADVFSECELLEQILEEKSIYWNNDIEYVLSMIIKTLDGYKIGDGKYKNLMPCFKNGEEMEFTKTLIRKTLLNYSTYKELIDKFAENWDIERIAMTDVVIIQLAINELIEFPEIPIKATFNEYIELSKYFSTQKSNIFINGLLDKISKHLIEEKKIIKTGRGLLEGDKTE